MKNNVSKIWRYFFVLTLQFRFIQLTAQGSIPGMGCNKVERSKSCVVFHKQRRTRTWMIHLACEIIYLHRDIFTAFV